jgi:predicted RecB family nuclease
MLWWQSHEPNAPELAISPATQQLFNHGALVGRFARELFPGGVHIDSEPWQYRQRCAATQAALAAGSSAIFEASFLEQRVFVSVDVLERDGHTYNLIEVKSTTQIKPEHVQDVAVQLHVLRATGVDVTKVEVMHINRECRYPDLSNLFTRVDVTAEAEAIQVRIPRQLHRMTEALAGTLPTVEVGDHCNAPHECPFMSRCRLALPAHHVSTLYRLGKRAKSLVAAGIETIHRMPPDCKLSPVAARQVRSVKADRIVVEDGLRDALEAIVFPVAFLDFETIAPPVPIWNGCAPYEATAVQMSCHVFDEQGNLEHFEYLAEGAGDPRTTVAEAVIRACRGAQTVLAYNASFERGCIERMANAVPSCRTELLAVAVRLVDLLPIVRNNVYHPDFGGSFSIKRVLPALVPSWGYDDLEIGDGATAQAILERLLLNGEAILLNERRKLRSQLLAYCRRDTFAMVKLLEVLRVHT